MKVIWSTGAVSVLLYKPVLIPTFTLLKTLIVCGSLGLTTKKEA